MTIIFNTGLPEEHTTAGTITTIFGKGDYMLSSNSAGSIGGGVLTLKVFNRDGVQIATSADLIYSELPTSEILSLPKGFKVQATLAGATDPSFKLEINQV